MTMDPDHLDDDAHNFTIQKSFEVARIIDRLLKEDECLRLKAAAMFSLVMADRLGHFKTGRRLNNFHDVVEKLRDNVKEIYKEEYRATSN